VASDGNDGATRTGPAAPPAQPGQDFPRNEMDSYARATWNMKEALRRMEAGDFAGAIRDLDQVVLWNPGNYWAYSCRAHARTKTGDYAGAVEDLTRAVRLSPDDGSLYRQRGYARRKAGDLAGAVVDLSEAVRLAPADAPAYAERGFARILATDFAGGRADLDEAVRLAPADGWVYRRRGYANLRSADFAGAAGDFSEAIRLGPADAWVYSNRGHARRGTGDFARAVTDYSEALRLDPADGSLYVERGDARNGAGDYTGAVEDYADGLLRHWLHRCPRAFVNNLARLQGPPANYRRLVPRLILCTVALLEATREWWDLGGAGGDAGPVEPDPVRAVIRLGTAVTEEAFGLPATGEPGDEFALRRLAEEGERLGAAAAGEEDPRRRNRAILGHSFAAMCREGRSAVGQGRWPVACFWEPLLYLTGNGRNAPMSRPLTNGRWTWSSHQWLRDGEACALLLCATGPHRAETVIDPGWLAWNGGEVPQMARAIYTRGSAGDMPVLADALRAAGCREEELLRHCREPHHCCGCWVLDALLGKR
jgi:tetratricopeptide (TPR) repeat protein